MRPRLLLRCLAIAGVLTGGSIMMQLFPARAAGPGMTERVSVDSTGTQGNGWSGNPSISADGRYVAMDSDASNLVAGDTNSIRDVFVRDRVTRATTRVSVDSAGSQGNGGSDMAAISADGRYVAFRSWASNLVPDDTNTASDVFVHDRVTGATQRVSVDSLGAQGQSDSYDPAFSTDGRYVAFGSNASNLVPADTNESPDVFVRDRETIATERVSVADGTGAQGNLWSYGVASFSGDGRYVAFQSEASNLVPGDTNAAWDIFVRDRVAGATERLSVGTAGAQANNYSTSPSMSSDGRYVAFYSEANNLVTGDTNGGRDVFVRDRDTSTTERVSVGSAGAQGNDWSDGAPISADGRYVAFRSAASNLVPGDTNIAIDVFLRDRTMGATERVSMDSADAQGNGTSWTVSITADGRYVAFQSEATTLVPGDTNGVDDVFVRDRVAWVAVGGVVQPPDVMALPSAAAPAGRNYAVYIIGAAAALVVVLGAARWRKRRA